MNAPPAQPARWSGRRWWAMLLLVLLVQLGLIYWLSDRSPLRVRTPAPTAALQLLQANPEVLELTDPTLFALPQRHGFSGRAWRELAAPDLRPTPAAQKPIWLDLPSETLAADFRQFSRTNTSGPRLVAPEPAPALTVPARAYLNLVPQHSRVRLGGDLANQPVPASIQPPDWPFADLLPNTIVQVVVDAKGRAMSVTRLNSCGLAPADNYAVEAVRSARFEPVPATAAPPHTQLRWGQVIFEWHTVPPKNGNAS